MQYIMVVDIDEALLEGDDSIENAANVLNDAIHEGFKASMEVTNVASVRPLSEVIAC